MNFSDTNVSFRTSCRLSGIKYVALFEVLSCDAVILLLFLFCNVVRCSAEEAIVLEVLQFIKLV